MSVEYGSVDPVSAEGIAALLVGAAAVIGSLVSGYVAIVNTRRIRDIDHAVNGRPLGAITMQKQVADLHDDRPFPPREGVDGAAIREMVAMLVADMYERREKEEA